MGMAKVGVQEKQVEELLKGVDIDTLRVEKGKVSSSGGMTSFFLPLMLMMMIYMTVIIYGVAVMRSVIEEKTSRVVEVLLSSVSSMQLMAGKILGVGAVGLTQVVIWATAGAVIGSPMIVAAKSMMKDVHLPAAVIIAFPTFFVLGYLLYSTMYAAVGAMVNSDEEAQQMQWPVLAPLVSCAVFASMVIRTPNSPFAQALSIFPLTSPIIMFVRITVATPPAWQIALSLTLLIATIYGMVSLCSRIYRVGILMYGKRPTLPEILKWIKYA
jgi:ABC-2 type transport system permease protein